MTLKDSLFQNQSRKRPRSNVRKYDDPQILNDKSAQDEELSHSLTTSKSPNSSALFGAETGAKLEPYQSQTGVKLEPYQSQTGAELEPYQSQEFRNKNETRARTRADLEPNWSQTRAKLEPELEPKFELILLSNLQKKVLLTAFNSCQFNGSRTTEPLTINHLAMSLESTTSAVKKAFQRLGANKFILRHKFKEGRGGWTSYEIPEHVFKELKFNETRAKLEPIWSQTRAKLEPELEPELEPNSPSSSRLITNPNSLNSTTTEIEQIGASPSAWDTITYASLTELHCPFGQRQIEQIKSWGWVLPEALQESIRNFAFALENNWTPAGGFKSSQLNYFMGCLKSNGLFEYDGYYQNRRKILDYSRARLAERAQDDEAIEAEMRRIKVRFWLKSLSEESKKIYSPYMLGLGENTEFGSSQHVDFIISNRWNQIELQVNELLDAANQNLEIAESGQNGH